MSTTIAIGHLWNVVMYTQMMMIINKNYLRLASKMKDFDYDEFYRSFANLWASKGALNFVYYYLTDEHPMSYLRVNVPLQQYDEFLDFYDIKEGDGMYLSPENRVTIW